MVGNDVRIDLQLSFDRIVNICSSSIAPTSGAHGVQQMLARSGDSNITSGQALMDYLTRRVDTEVVI